MKKQQRSPRCQLANAHAVVAAAAGIAAVSFAALPVSAASAVQSEESATQTPIKHVIVIVGENRTFDHVFGTYEPGNGQSVQNLLSEGIVNADGSPGPNFAKSRQFQATVTGTAQFALAPSTKSPYGTLPSPNTGGTATAASDASGSPYATYNAAAQAEGDSLEASDIGKLMTGASGLPAGSRDSRIANYNALQNGPYPLQTPGQTSLYDAYLGGPVHRFYQNWQQSDCDVSHASRTNPSGCLMDLFAWVETTIGAGSNGNAQPAAFNDQTTREGSNALGFHNVNNGDVPYFVQLARDYTISDNYHQPVMGGTGANSIMIGAADAYYYTDGNGQPSTPPLNQIENPNPAPGSNNWYTQDGYSGGSYSNCSDTSQPGVGPISKYLASLTYHPKMNCAPQHYYLLNNYNPGYNGDGTVLDRTTSPFTIPPSPVRTIGDTLLERHIPWKYYGEGWNTFITTPKTSVYCNICNPFLYESSIMTNKAVRDAHLADTTDLYSDIASGDLPAVSFVKPGGRLDGHPTSSKFELYEAFVRKIVDGVQSNPKLWASTAIFITVDEGGGYYDSGYIQPVDFFGDGPRIPMILVSPYSRGGRVAHGYSDHASLSKFIERNWHLPPITGRSRDNLPNPVQRSDNPYVPVNAPAIGDLFDTFNFGRNHSGGGNAGHDDGDSDGQGGAKGWWPF
ncbi:alkaline phosphatase family protein [Paraburkholderia aromaticivorans]|uniref:Phosphoesterase n=1 Tax=Paraburkholderia aromaticivorans TaxID=2026199 RepID=A0A248VXZ2_9BURK|nr:alkaline phosphatase family protein [Paraburkholderia aromaticivorans]ASW03250.1 phosphoesterase [Paraburkholderia aromaticivorans]